MKTTDFLSRVVAPGNFLALNWKTPGAGTYMRARMYPRAEVGSAASFAEWVSEKDDSYFALASFDVAHLGKPDKSGRPTYQGERLQINAQNLKCFWIDVDVQRPGETKTDCYATRRDAAVWLAGFLVVTKLPPPNLRVDSGYGFHWYWILEDALSRAEWQPYADMLVQALRDTGFKSIAGLSNDAARILRPPNTLNHKGGTTVPVRVMDGSRGDYPNDLILPCLEPWRAAALAVQPRTPYAVSASGALATGGPAAAFTAVAQPNMTAAAQVGTSVSQTRSFAAIAEKCEQVKQSLAAGGAGDPYQLWYLGFLSLAHHCEDGADFVHEISKGDQRYAAANVDAHVARIAAEKARDDVGPPRCAKFDEYRPGVCQTCAFWGQQQSPWALGVKEPVPAEMPPSYRRQDGSLQVWTERPDGASLWVSFLKGDVLDPILDKTPKGYLLTFTYELAGRRFPVRALEAEIPTEATASRAYFAPQHVSIKRLKAPLFGDFLLAWIEHLREQHAERTEYVKPFGYAVNTKGAHVGIGLGGTLYRSDGTEEAAPGADAELVEGFQPVGDMTKWRAAYDLVCTGRPDLQVIAAAAFGAPLMHFTGQKGLVISMWSQGSGRGKSAAMRVGQTVWSAPRFMTALKDTDNSIQDKIAATQFMPCFWDEMRANKQQLGILVDTLFTIAQGKEKARMTSAITHRKVREWETLVVVASNGPLMDHVAEHSTGTDAGALRLFEHQIIHPSLENTGAAARIIMEVDTNYGHAGQQFVRYLATHYDEVKKLVGNFSDAVEKDFGAIGDERMYVAGIASMLAGARIANTLGLAMFDLRGLHALLKDTFAGSRIGRAVDLVSSNGRVDAEQILSRFVSDYMGNRIITSCFVRQGPSGKNAFTPLWVPIQGGRAEIHTAIDDKVMRINRATFVAWCRRQGLNALDIMRQMEAQLRVVKDRAVIGGGVLGYAGGRIAVLDVPIDTPAMVSYLLVPASAATASPLAGPPGNQARV
jgi:hypothetical protein